MTASGTPLSREEEHFRRQEMELIEKIRQRNLLAEDRRGMGEALGVANESILAELQAMGFSRETVTLLHLVPLVQVGWIDGEISRAEAQRIFEAARLRGVVKDSAAYRLLEDWMERRPSGEFFEKSLRIIRDILGALPEDQRRSGVHSLVSCCTEIAAASGGLLGVGSRISSAEKEALAAIALELERHHAAAARNIVEGVYG